jgi:hypothetical protein
MALDLSAIKDQPEDSPHSSKAIQKILRQQELQNKLLKQASSHLRILEEQWRFQQWTTPYQSSLAQLIRADTIQAQNIQARAIQSMDTLRRETAKLLTPIDLHRLLTPIDPDLKYKAVQAFRLAQLQYDPVQNLIDSLAYREAIQRQLIGPWPLVNPWRDAETLRWLLWALQQGDSDDQEAALTELATMIRRPRLTHEAGLQLHYRARLMGISTDEYWRRVVLPQALLFVWEARRVPRRIQLGGNGQDRVLDEQGKWTAQAPEDKLSTELLASYLFDEVPKAAICILTDQDYPKPSNELWHAPPIKKKDDQGTIERIPRVVPLPPRERDLTQSHGHICEPSPELMAILKLDLQKLATNASPQQRQLLDLLVKGYKIKEIASELHITSQAAHAQLNRLQQKYEAG